jgi:hypothetical protein
MSWQRATVFFVIGITIFILGYDGIAYWRGGLSATISSLISTEGHTIEAIPFAFGLLMGHFFL